MSLDFFLRSFSKNRVFLTKTADMEELKSRITRKVRLIDVPTLCKVFRNLIKCACACIEVNGLHFEHLSSCQHYHSGCLDYLSNYQGCLCSLLDSVFGGRGSLVFLFRLFACVNCPPGFLNCLSACLQNLFCFVNCRSERCNLLV